MSIIKACMANGVLFLALVLGGVSLAGAEPESAYTININTADAQTLAASIKGIGEKRAQQIVAWRDANGSFSSLEQLMEIKGIGPRFLEKNRDLLTLK